MRVAVQRNSTNGTTTYDVDAEITSGSTIELRTSDGGCVVAWHANGDRPSTRIHGRWTDVRADLTAHVDGEEVH